MAKKIVRLTESQLHNVISESVNQILNEISSTRAMAMTKDAHDNLSWLKRHNENGQNDFAIDQLTDRINKVKNYADIQFKISPSNRQGGWWPVRKKNGESYISYTDDSNPDNVTTYKYYPKTDEVAVYNNKYKGQRFKANNLKIPGLTPQLKMQAKSLFSSQNAYKETLWPTFKQPQQSQQPQQNTVAPKEQKPQESRWDKEIEKYYGSPKYLKQQYEFNKKLDQMQDDDLDYESQF